MSTKSIIIIIIIINALFIEGYTVSTTNLPWGPQIQNQINKSIHIDNENKTKQFIHNDKHNDIYIIKVHEFNNHTG